MAKNIKFSLKLKDDFPVRSMNELKEHFDLSKIIGYFLDDRLLRWLESRYYYAEADAIRLLDKNDSELKLKICSIFSVVYEENSSADVSSIEIENNRLSTIRQYTSNEKILNSIAQVAFNQEELEKLLDENKFYDIYLCNNNFTIPLRIKDKHYVGIGKVEVKIDYDEQSGAEFKASNVSFDNVKFFNDANQLFKLGWEFYGAKDYELAFQYYKKAADLGNSDAMKEIGNLYRNHLIHHQAFGVSNDYQTAMEWYKKAAELGNTDAMIEIGHLYGSGYGVEKGKAENYWAQLEWYKKAAELGNTSAMISVGTFYGYCNRIPRDWPTVMKWYKKAADLGNADAMNRIASLYFNGTGKGQGIPQSDSKAFEWWKKAAELGDIYSMERVANLYSHGWGVARSEQKADEWYKKAEEARESKKSDKKK